MLWNGDEKLYMAVREPDGYYGKITPGMWAVWPTWESWNWPGHEGRDIDVEVYSRCQAVRLYHNGNLLGEKPTTREQQFKAVFTLPYQEGELKAEGIDNGKVVETCTLKSAGKASKILLDADRSSMKADGGDLVFVSVQIADNDGTPCPLDESKLEFSVKGPAVIQAVGNANIKDLNPTHGTNTCNAWKGKALIVLRSTHKRGAVTLKINSPGLKSSTLRLECK